MPQVDFASSVGTIVGWAPDLELVFDTSFRAADLVLTAEGPDVRVSVQGQSVVLSSVALDGLIEANFLFQTGDVLRLAVGSGDAALAGGAGDDGFLLVGGGADSATGGDGNDTFDLGAGLDAADRIDGGAGTDDSLRLGGGLNATLAADTLRDVERIVWAGGGTAVLVLDDAAVSSTLVRRLVVDATAAGEADSLRLDAGAVTSGWISVNGGEGADSVIGTTVGDLLSGGDGADTLDGGAGQDRLSGGLGADVLTGGAGDDLFTYDAQTTRSEATPSAPDLITDFEGLGAAGGDRIDLPGQNFAGQPLAFNAAPGGLLPEFIGDGFTDVVWSRVAGPGFTGIEVLVDMDDDGEVGERDLLIRIATADPAATLTIADFTDALRVWRGTGGDDAATFGAEANTAYGVGGNDTLDGGAGADSIYGGEGDDSLLGSGSFDLLDGGAGNDTLDGGSEDDFLNGGTGADLIRGDAGADYLTGDLGNDTLQGGDGGDVLDGGADDDTLAGGEGGDNLSGGTEADLMQGEAGADTLAGGEGDDTLAGGEGDDRLTGGGGTDRLTGGAGADVIDLQSAADSLLNQVDLVTDFQRAEGDRLQLGSDGYFNAGLRPLVFMGRVSANFSGEAGDPFQRTGDGLTGAFLGAGFSQVWWWVSGGDVIVYADVNDNFELDGADLVLRLAGLTSLSAADFVPGSFRVLIGTPGPDTLTGGAGTDTIYGLAGSDSLVGGGSFDLLVGAGGDDTLMGEGGGDRLFGGLGNDRLFGGDGGADSLFGDAGNDLIDFGSGGAGDVGYGGAGDDTLTGGSSDDGLYGDAGNDSLDGGAGNDAVSDSLGDDTLRGGQGDDWLYGGQGNDLVEGGEGNDTLTSDTGRDTLTGGAGADVFAFGSSDASLQPEADRVTDFSRAEGDLIDLGQSGALDNGSNPLVLMGQLRAAFTGVLGQAFVRGDGLAGSDLGEDLAQIWWRVAGPQVHLYHDVDDDGIFTAADMLIRFDGISTLGLADFVPGTFLVQVGTPGPDALTGTAGSDTIFGLGGNDTIDGVNGGDRLYGGAGDDSLIGTGDLGQGTLEGGAGNDTLLGGDSYDQLYGEAGNDLLDGGGEGDALWGGLGRDTLSGNDGDDGLNGDEGEDSLLGQDGNDYLYGGEANDTLRGGAGEDWLAGGEGVDRLEGDEGLDTLDGGAGADRLEGGAEADLFAFGDSLDSTLAETDRLLDFDRVEGDRIALGSFGGLSGLRLVFAGELAEGFDGLEGSTFTPAGDFDTAALAGEFAQVWWQATGADLRLYVDADGDLLLGAGDLVVDLEGVTTLARDDFAEGTFVVIVGTSGADSLTGGTGSDTIFGLAGDDTIEGLDEPDRIDAGAGNDSVLGGLGGDTIFGGAGDDSIQGEDGFDQIYGEDGNDTIDGGNDGDALWGYAGNDLIFGGFGADAIYGGEGEDTLFSGADDDVVLGDGGNDSLSAAGGDDDVNGGEGDDSLHGGSGNDRLSGDGGADRLTGGADADEFFWAFGAESALAARDTVTDFSRIEGDSLLLGSAQGEFEGPYRPLVWVGQLAAGFTGTLGAAFVPAAGMGGADIGEGMAQIFWAAGGGGVTLYVDANDNFALDEGDLVVRLDGLADLTQADFAAGTFDNIVGNRLDNALTGTAGFDLIYALAGNDTVTAAAGGDRVAAGAGNDSVLGGLGADTLFGEGGNDALFGGDDFDQIYGDEGDDTLDGGFGGDLVFAGEGNDLLLGQSEDDALYGGSGDDTLIGHQGADYLLGDEGNDQFDYGRASHFGTGEGVQGGAGYDRIRFLGTLDGDRLLLTAAVADVEEVTMGTGSAALSVNAAAVEGALLIRGNAGANGITGTALNDTLAGGGGADTMVGGEGVDLLSYDLDTTGVTVDLAAGTASGGHAAGDRFAGIEGVRGGAGDDSLSGNGLANRLEGGLGADTLVGRGGNDTYVVNGADLVVEAAGAGYDTVLTAQTHTLAANVEVLTLLGTAAIDGTGNAGANLIRGNAGANRLEGGGGVDTLSGGAGWDTYVTEGDDLIFEVAGGGLDTVLSSGTYTLAAHVERLTLTGAGAIDGTGNGLANTIRGNDAANRITGAGGADVLFGGLDADTFVYAAGHTGLGAARDTIADFVSGADVIDLSAIDANQDTGGDQAFSLRAGAGANAVWTVRAGADLFLLADVNGDAFADLSIRLLNTAALAPGDVAL
jgi:Ca2+-binding RTX toxin-like protein